MSLYFCRWLCLSVYMSFCMSVCHGAPSNCFFFVSSWNRTIFWPSVLPPCGTLQNCFSSIFDLGPVNPKIYSPKFGTKSPTSRLVWQIDQRCLGLLGDFRGWPIQWNHAKCCGPTLVAMATKFGEIWAIFHRIAYKSPCMAHRPEIFGPTRGPTRRPTLVAMATTFGL